MELHRFRRDRRPAGRELQRPRDAARHGDRRELRRARGFARVVGVRRRRTGRQAGRAARRLGRRVSPNAPTREIDALFAEHGERVTRVCRAVLHSDDLARDAAQEAFVRLWRRMEREPALEHPGSWLRAAALSSALDLARRRAKVA
ncbi:MAG: sigma-70 family RNA polymerase sigma factor, partial [Planctomycetes bacterium]|nr:sigma-70 family RNA polymerase sigma factor [Planctomycetota bacterium]